MGETEVTVQSVHVVPTFHYDVAYLKSYGEYLPACFEILDQALRLLQEHPAYRFLIEQVILLEEYCRHRPDAMQRLRQFAAEGRVEVAPGMYVMPDMNHPDLDSLYMQVKLGKDWLAKYLGIDPKVCWIADCWGHPSQLPQILKQCGYDYYVFWRCMRRDVRRNDFHWRALDGTTIRTHWLARGYGNVRFPTAAQVVNAEEMDLIGSQPAQMLAFINTLQEYGPSERILVCNGGDVAMPQASALEALQRLQASGELPSIDFDTISGFLNGVRWDEKPHFDGEFNSAFQGTFTTNIRIKQWCRRLVNQLKALDSMAVCLNQAGDFSRLWKPVLKQHFHDIICGTLTDAAVTDSLDELKSAESEIAAAVEGIASRGSIDGWYNPLSFKRTEIVQTASGRVVIQLPPFGVADASTARLLATGRPDVSLPIDFQTDSYAATIGPDGYLTSLIERSSGRQLVNAARLSSPFGGLYLQFDYGDSWLAFAGPINGGGLQSALTQNDPDPLDRPAGDDLVAGTQRPRIDQCDVLATSTDEIILEQHGRFLFWRMNLEFVTRITLSRFHPHIEFVTTIQPQSRHYRIRAAFPSTLQAPAATRRDEIAGGFQVRFAGEHAAQTWIDFSDDSSGLALFNESNPGNNVHDGVLMLTLFRSAAMQYKTPSALSYNEGVEHEFRYAIMPHGPFAPNAARIIQAAHGFVRPPLFVRVHEEQLGPTGWSVDQPNVIISALRPADGQIFVRLYEATGVPTNCVLRVGNGCNSIAAADGMQRPTGPFAACAQGEFPLQLRPFEIRNLLVRP